MTNTACASRSVCGSGFGTVAALGTTSVATTATHENMNRTARHALNLPAHQRTRSSSSAGTGIVAAGATTRPFDNQPHQIGACRKLILLHAAAIENEIGAGRNQNGLGLNNGRDSYHAQTPQGRHHQ
ncbi:hypothetical protein [Diaphorobacter sp.]|uniref:hypothetical protein n=1 Tax=Diaphorobacter sp. TaxID=1934310 RepID=UPI0028A5FCC3|nr:hypothetical protein [Diaphorobacter sp.]